MNELVAAAPAAASAPPRPAPLAERLGEEAFGRFHAAVAPRLLAYVRSHVPNRAEADDLAQEAFTRVLASSFTPESEEHLIRYLYRTAANLLHDRGRSAARGTTVPLEEAERADPAEPAVPLFRVGDHTGPYHVQVDVHKAANQMFIALDGRGEVAIFPECSFP